MLRSLLAFILLLPVCAEAFLFVDPVNLVQNTTTATNSVSALINQVKSIQYQLQFYQQNMSHLGQFHYQDIGNNIQ